MNANEFRHQFLEIAQSTARHLCIFVNEKKHTKCRILWAYISVMLDNNCDKSETKPILIESQIPLNKRNKYHRW